MLEFIENEGDLDLNNILLDAISIHNNNIHTTTGYKPINLFYNTNENAFNGINKNIEKAFNNKNTYFSEINKGNKLLVNKAIESSGKMIKIMKNKNYFKDTIATCLQDYSGGLLLLLIRIDETQYLHKEGDELFTDIKNVTSITYEQWIKIVNENNNKKN